MMRVTITQHFTIRLLRQQVWQTTEREKQRIIKLTQYPQDHTKDECELANKLPSFEEAREKLQAAQEIITP